MLEKHIEKKVVAHAKRQKYWCRKFVSPSSSGVPDRIFAANGKIIFVELKRPGGKPSELQLREMRLLTEAGIKAIWCDSAQEAIEQIDDWLVADECV